MIKYVHGDLFSHVKKSKKQVVVPHIVNNVGLWGSGFVIGVSDHYPGAEKSYRSKRQLELGDVDYYTCDNITVANMVAQNGVKGYAKVPMYNDPKPIRYAALCECMGWVHTYCKTWGCEIHAPMFGADRAGGNWSFISELIDEIWRDISVTIYYLNKESFEKNVQNNRRR